MNEMPLRTELAVHAEQHQSTGRASATTFFPARAARKCYPNACPSVLRCFPSRFEILCEESLARLDELRNSAFFARDRPLID